MAADARRTRAVLGVSLQLVVLALLHNAGPAEGVCLVSSTKVTGCKACAKVKQATVCTGCSTGYAFKRSAKGSGGVCGEHLAPNRRQFLLLLSYRLFLIHVAPTHPICKPLLPSAPLPQVLSQ
jgi:hypothetical protein